MAYAMRLIKTFGPIHRAGHGIKTVTGACVISGSATGTGCATSGIEKCFRRCRNITLGYEKTVANPDLTYTFVGSNTHKAGVIRFWSNMASATVVTMSSTWTAFGV